MSDDAKKEIRQFAISVFLACVPALATWGVDSLREKLKNRKEADQ